MASLNVLFIILVLAAIVAIVILMLGVYFELRDRNTKRLLKDLEDK